MSKSTASHVSAACPEPTADIGHRFPDAMSAFLSSWLQDAGRMQQQAILFFNKRLEKDVAYLARLADCASPAEFASLHAELLGVMVADYMTESQVQLALLRDAARYGIDQAVKTAHAETAH